MARRKPRHDIPIPDDDIAGAYFGNTPKDHSPRQNNITTNPLGYWSREEKYGERGMLKNTSNQTGFRNDYYQETFFPGPRQYPRKYYSSHEVPVYPEPQAMRNMPLQMAGYDDYYNTRNTPASTANMKTYGSGPYQGYEARDFLSKIDTVVLNPEYKRESMADAAKIRAKAKSLRAKTGNATLRTQYRIIESADKVGSRFFRTDQVLKDLAKANEQYFGKKFFVLSKPMDNAGDPRFQSDKKIKKQYANYLKKGYENTPLRDPFSSVDWGRSGSTYDGKYYNPNRTLQVNVFEDQSGNLGSAPIYGFYQPAKEVAPIAKTNRSGGPEGWRYPQIRTLGPHMDKMALAHPNMFSRNVYEGGLSMGSVAQHELGHVLGIGHSTKFQHDEWQGDKNTVMSYQRGIDPGVKLLPSDINMWKEVYDKNDPASRAARNKKKGSASQLKKR